MSEKHDHRFTNLFALVVGVLVGVAFAIYFLSTYVSGRTQREQVFASKESQREINERIAPVGKVAIAGQDNSALDAAIGKAEAAATPAASNEVLPGDQVYQSTCVACHGAGVAGAPKFGDKAAWSARISKGPDTLHQHAIQGFQGANGVMPPKGGRTDLSDKSIANAVDYMVNAAK
jgi:cytochrome c5